jgi:hypothetical protein
MFSDERDDKKNKKEERIIPLLKKFPDKLFATLVR